jgi:hypothetical protein
MDFPINRRLGYLPGRSRGNGRRAPRVSPGEQIQKQWEPPCDRGGFACFARVRRRRRPGGYETPDPGATCRSQTPSRSVTDHPLPVRASFAVRDGTCACGSDDPCSVFVKLTARSPPDRLRRGLV